MSNIRSFKRTTKINYIEMLESLLERKGELAEYYHLFHNYSICNQILLLSQFHERGLKPQPVATLKNWNSIGRRVKAGSKAMYMLMPFVKRWTEIDKYGEEKEYSVMFFSSKNFWFPLSSTEGTTTLDKLESPKFSLKRILKNLDIEKVDFEMINGNCQGYCESDTGNIAINPIDANPQKTAIHEIAHSLLHCGENKSIHDDKGNNEAEAESVALVVSSILGIADSKTIEYSVGYIKSWMSDQKKDFLMKSAKRIVNAVDKILKANKS